VGEFYDAAMSGVDPIDACPGFAAMLKRPRTAILQRAPRALIACSAITRH
jgi:hypothetical protein